MIGDGYRVSWDDAHQLARLDWAPGAHCDLATAERVDRDVQDLGHGEVRLLVDLRPNASIDRDARHFFISLSPHYRAVALLAGSPATRMLANFFLGFQRGTVPVRLFTSETDAVAWLTSDP